MARRRLGDLLREEAHKTPDIEAVQVTAEELPDSDENSSETEIPIGVTKESSLTVTNTNTTKRTNPTKAELEATITELRAALQEYSQQESSWQQQIADLQSELQEHKTLVQKLQAELKRTDEIKAELEQAKKVILQLTEVNSNSSKEIKTYKKESDFKPQNSALTRLPQYPQYTDQPSSKSSQVFDENVGWFD